MFIFIGERRSRRARAMGVRWEQGHLAAKSLFDALRASGIDLEAQTYSIFDERCLRLRVCQSVLQRLSRLGPERRIVALGNRVHMILQRHDAQEESFTATREVAPTDEMTPATSSDITTRWHNLKLQRSVIHDDPTQTANPAIRQRDAAWVTTQVIDATVAELSKVSLADAATLIRAVVQR